MNEKNEIIIQNKKIGKKRLGMTAKKSRVWRDCGHIAYLIPCGRSSLVKSMRLCYKCALFENELLCGTLTSGELMEIWNGKNFS